MANFLTDTFRMAGDILEAIDESAEQRLGDTETAKLRPGETHTASAPRVQTSMPTPQQGGAGEDQRAVLSGASQEAVVRERDMLRREVASLERRLASAGADTEAEQQRSAALKKQVEEAYAEVSSLKARMSEMKEEMEEVDDDAFQGLRQEKAHLAQTLAQVQEAARHASTSHAAELAAARQEATSSAEALAASLDDLRALRASADEVEAGLRGEVAALTAALAAVQAETSRPATVEAGGLSDPEFSPAQLAAVTAELRAERRLSAAVREELAAARAAVQEKTQEATRHRIAAAAAESKVQSLTKQVSEAVKASSEASAAAQGRQAAEAEVPKLKARLREVSQSLLKKQETVDSLAAERTALAQRVIALEGRVESAEAAAVGGVPADQPGMLKHRSGGAAQRAPSTVAPSWSHMPTASAHGDAPRAMVPLARLPGIARHRRLAQAVDGVDRTVAGVGRFLASSPLARLLVLVYLALLHVWVFGVTAFHTHAMEDGLQRGAAGPGKLPRPPKPITHGGH